MSGESASGPRWVMEPDPWVLGVCRSVEEVRYLPTVIITVSLDPLDTTRPGYQAPTVVANAPPPPRAPAKPRQSQPAAVPARPIASQAVEKAPAPPQRPPEPPQQSAPVPQPQEAKAPAAVKQNAPQRQGKQEKKGGKESIPASEPVERAPAPAPAPPASEDVKEGDGKEASTATAAVAAGDRTASCDI